MIKNKKQVKSQKAKVKSVSVREAVPLLEALGKLAPAALLTFDL
jgi:hypothetical protein